MIYRILKNTFPSLFIVWTVYFLELMFYETEVLISSGYYLEQIKIFISYTLLGLIIGGLSAGLFAKKKKKYSYTFENDIKKYSKYFLKNFGISFMALLALTLRELINNPLLFKDTLLNNSFWLSGLFAFIRDKFSPLYFTIFFAIIIIMSVHNLVKNLSMYHGTNRALAYFTAVILSVLFVFNYGFLNASVRSEIKNIVFIGVENLERSYLSSGNIKDRYALKELKSHSYDFENCFTPVLDPQSVILSVLTSLNPEKWEFSDGLLSMNAQNKTVFQHLNGIGINAVDYSDIRFRIERTAEEAGDNNSFPSSENILRSKVLLSHFLSPVVFNNSMRESAFPEARLISGYRDRIYLKRNISQTVGGGNENFLLYYTIPDYRDYLPYPYYRLADQKAEEAYLNYLNDEINMIYHELAQNRITDKAVICLFGIPKGGEGLRADIYKIPLYVSSRQFEIERKVKNRYTTLDILPTVLDAAGYDLKKFAFEGKSFFDPEFIRQEILLTDISPIRIKKGIKFVDSDGLISKNRDLINEMNPILSRALIISDMKLNAVPDSSGIIYELFDIGKDPEEKNDLSSSDPAAARSMRSALENRMKKVYNYRVVNGHFLK